MSTYRRKCQYCLKCPISPIFWQKTFRDIEHPYSYFFLFQVEYFEKKSFDEKLYLFIKPFEGPPAPPEYPPPPPAASIYPAPPPPKPPSEKSPFMLKSGISIMIHLFPNYTSISSIHTFVNIPAVIRKRSVFLSSRAGIFTKV